MTRRFLIVTVCGAALVFALSIAIGIGVAARLRANRRDSAEVDRLLTRALDRLDAGDVAASRSLTERVLAVAPRTPIARANLGRLHKRQGDYAAALAEHKLALAEAPDLPDLYYNIACYYALLKRKEDAIAWLAAALDHGFGRLDVLRQDPDLQSLRGDPRFDLLVRTGRLATGRARLHVDLSTRRARVDQPFELSAVVEREAAGASGSDALVPVEVRWSPEPPVVRLREFRETAVDRGDGVTIQRVTVRWVLRAGTAGIFSLPPVMAEVGDHTVEGRGLVVEVTSAPGSDAGDGGGE